MLGISLGEFLIVGVVAFLVIDPRELPHIFYTIRKTFLKLKNEINLIRLSVSETVDDLMDNEIDEEIYDVSEVYRYIDRKKNLPYESKSDADSKLPININSSEK